MAENLFAPLLLSFLYLFLPKGIIFLDDWKRFMSIIQIKNSETEALILPEVGGRIVSYRHIGKSNVLESDPSLWEEAQSDRLVPAPDMLDFKGYNGHEVWVGPQSQWWKQQTLNKEKIDSDLFWPPDPYISFGAYEVVEQSATAVTIVGEPSPISGIRMTKRVSLEENGDLFFEVEAENIRESEVAWDLWLITRVNGHLPNFVPVASEADVFLGEPSHPWQGRPTYKVENGYFSFTPLVNDGKYEECTGKAYIKAMKPIIIAHCGDERLTLEFEHHDFDTIHPEQAEIELYNFVHKEASKSLLELEYHTPYKKLASHEKISTWSRWHLSSLTPGEI